jgi:hypothetical protein
MPAARIFNTARSNGDYPKPALSDAELQQCCQIETFPRRGKPSLKGGPPDLGRSVGRGESSGRATFLEAHGIEAALTEESLFLLACIVVRRSVNPIAHALLGCRRQRLSAYTGTLLAGISAPRPDGFIFARGPRGVIMSRNTRTEGHSNGNVRTRKDAVFRF